MHEEDVKKGQAYAQKQKFENPSHSATTLPVLPPHKAHLLSSPQRHKPLTVSTPLSTTALTLALSALFPHSTSKSSNQTFATNLSNLISTPGTGIPRLCNLFNSVLSSADNWSSGAMGGGNAVMLEGSVESGVEVSMESGLAAAGVPFVVAVVVLLRGRVMGRTASSPNWASRKRKRRARRVEGSVVRWGCGFLKRWVSFVVVISSASGWGVWLWECCFEDSGGWVSMRVDWGWEGEGEETYVGQLLVRIRL